MPSSDSTAWALLRDAGAVLLGKTVMSEAAWGVDFPPVRNPWDVRRNPGLSSGGSGAAVAAGMCFMAMGSDTGGSIRIPAGLSGVVGLKATYGRVSKAGVMPHTWSLDTAGPLTRRVEDAALTLRVIAGFDPRDPGSADMPVGDYLASLKKGIRSLRVGVPSEHFWDRIESRVEPVVRQALRDLEGAGARVEEVSIPHMAGALGAILVTEMASVTAWHDTYLRQPDRRARYTPEVRALMDAGKFIFATDFLKAQRLRRVLIDEVRAAFAGVDVLATPTLPLCGWEVSQSHVEIAGQPEHVLHACWRYTYPWNLTGLPALSVPCGFADGLPVGLQLVGKPFDEATILRVGEAYQQATRWHEQHPADPAPGAT
jgi:aspartyl-tRNA(Asn)/glutamyl-tRNA(Gln) amidotransferase subunit A